MLKSFIRHRLPFLILLVSLVSSIVFASDPPKNTGTATPPIWIKPAMDWFDNKPVIPDPNAPAEPLIAAGYGSSTLHSQFRPRKRGASTSSAATSSFENTTPLAGSHFFRFLASPLTVPSGSPQPMPEFYYAMANTGESEPSIIANNIFHAENGTTLTHHVAAFHHPATQNGSYDNWVHANYTTDATSSNGLSTPALMYVPSGYTFSTDPWLSQNSFADGIAPRRIYLSGNTDTRNINGDGVSPSAVRVWYSDTGGMTWSGGWPVDSRAAGQGLLDRPTSAVSEYSGTRGYYYVSYAEFTGNGINLWITSSTNGVHPFCNAVPPIRCYPPQLTTALVSNIDGPFEGQVVTNPTTGRLYVLWWTQFSPFMNHAIRMRRSSDWSVSNFEVDGFGNPIEYTIANSWGATGYLPSGLKAGTTVTAKYNSATGRIDMAWHGSDATTNGNAIYFMSFDPDAVTSQNTPMSYARIDASGDQYEPILDHDPNGWTFISYLSNQDDAGNSRYKHYGVAVAPWGYIYPATALESSTHTAFWPGDYHGNFYWSSLDSQGARWFTVDAPEHPDGNYTDIRWTGVK